MQAFFCERKESLRAHRARPMMANMDASTIIDALGGTGKVANLCGITPGSVSQWRNKGIPHPWAKFLRAARPKTFIRLEREAAARAAEEQVMPST